MVDTLPEEAMAAPRKSGIGPAIVAGLVLFLMGGALVAYLVWSGAAAPLGLSAATSAVSATAEQARGNPAIDQEVALPTATALARQQGGLDQRVASLEQRLARLDMQAAAVEGHTARAEALLVAFAARRAIERGAPLGYLADQLRVRFGDAKPNSVAAILDAADHPVTVDKLIGRLSALEAGLQQTGEGGVMARLKQQLGGLFVIRRAETPSPQPAKRLERARLFLESGRVDAAIGEVRNLPGAETAKDWIADAERFARAQAALDLLESSALLETNGLKNAGGQPVL